LQRPDFTVDPHSLRLGLLANGYVELSITSEHAIFAASLPQIHKDPFDRLLVAQATVEGIMLLTSDRIVAKYPGPIQLV
jgi:PIN domain nuclease of toxin-antitoxin system